MIDSHNPLPKDVQWSLSFVAVLCALLLLLSSCSAQVSVQHERSQMNELTDEIRYQIICVIHGDGEYVYHDTSGYEYKADEEALKGAAMMAQQNPYAEVFVFHQKPRKHFLFMFPLHDGEFYYYRNTRLVATEAYWRSQTQPRFNAEVATYQRYHAANESKVFRAFLYFGHEIPEFDSAGYDGSYPEQTFTVSDLADAMKDFSGDSSRFDLAVLSTCFGGTPYTVSELGPFAKYVIASPDNLHLSYFGLNAFEKLETSVSDGNTYAFAKQVAQQSFNRLTSVVQTAVSVSLYDVDRVREFTASVRAAYVQRLGTLASVAANERCDCADLSEYALPTMSEGVDVLYRPARFGRWKNKVNHSGWECWKAAQTSISHSN